MSGSENGTPTRRASSAGHAARWPAAKIPADCTPWLLLVPSATNRAKSARALTGATLAAGPGDVPNGGAALEDGGAVGSAHATTTSSAPRGVRERLIVGC